MVDFSSIMSFEHPEGDDTWAATMDELKHPRSERSRPTPPTPADRHPWQGLGYAAGLRCSANPTR